MKIDKELDADKRKQLIDFYKAIKMAAKILPRNGAITQQKINQHVDEIISELKKEQPDTDKIQRLTDHIQQISNPGMLNR